MAERQGRFRRRPPLKAFMLVRRYAYAHLLRLGPGRALAVHALTGLRLSLDDEVAGLLEWFAEPRDMPDELAGLPAARTLDPDILAGCLATLMEQGLLTDKAPQAEQADHAEALGETHGRAPGEALDALRDRLVAERPIASDP